MALSALLTTLTLTAASPALADQTLGLGQAANADGVVTSWRIQTATPQTVRLRSTQDLMSGTATTATSDPVAAGTTPLQQAVAARLPIAAGGKLALLGSSGSPTVDATVEPDGDGDGYGDTTQDACATDFTDHEAPCGGTATFGSPLTLTPDPRGFSGSGGPMQALQQLAPGAARATAPLSAGILTRWRARIDPLRGDTVLQVLRPKPSTTDDVVVAETAPIHVTDAGVVTLPAAIVVKTGDRLAARSVLNAPIPSSDLGAVAYRAGDDLEIQQPPAKVQETFTGASGTYNGRRLLVQADVEPDADGDGKGDVTQDSADVRVTGSAPAAVEATESWSHAYTLSNVGPDAALDLRVEIRPGFAAPGFGPAGSSCTDITATQGDGVVCTLPKLAAGASVSFGPGFIEAAIWPPFPGHEPRRSRSPRSRPTPIPPTTRRRSARRSSPTPPSSRRRRSPRSRRAPTSSAARVTTTSCAAPCSATAWSATTAATCSRAWAATTAWRVAPATTCWTRATATTASPARRARTGSAAGPATTS